MSNKNREIDAMINAAEGRCRNCGLKLTPPDCGICAAQGMTICSCGAINEWLDVTACFEEPEAEK